MLSATVPAAFLNPPAFLLLGPVAPPAISGSVEFQPATNVSPSVTTPQVGNLLGSALENVQTLGELAGTVVSDPDITNSLRIDLASLTAAINQVVNDEGNGSAGAGSTVQIGVTSTANPEVAGAINALLANVANELQSIDTTAGAVGTNSGDSLANPVTAGLSQINNVVVGLNLLISGASGGTGTDLPGLENNLAGNELTALGAINGLTTAFGQAPGTTTTDFENTAESLGTFINSTAQSVNAVVPNVAATVLNPLNPLSSGQPLALTTAGTSFLQDFNGFAVNPLTNQPLALTSAGTSPLQDVNGFAVNPSVSQSVAQLATTGTNPVQDVNDLTANPLTGPSLTLPSTTIVAGNELQTVGVPAALANPFNTAGNEVATVGVPADFSNNPLNEASDIAQAQLIDTEFDNPNLDSADYVDQTADIVVASLDE